MRLKQQSVMVRYNPNPPHVTFCTITGIDDPNAWTVRWQFGDSHLTIFLGGKLLRYEVLDKRTRIRRFSRWRSYARHNYRFFSAIFLRNNHGRVMYFVSPVVWNYQNVNPIGVTELY
jgi:hypothetical protein